MRHTVAESSTSAVPTPASAPHALPRADRTAAVRAVLAAASIAAFLTLAFLWPLRSATAKDIPLVVAGPPQGVAVVERALRGTASPFELATVASREAAVEAVRTRRAYGALVVTPGRTVDVEILTASAASPAVPQALEQAASRIAGGAAEARAHSVDLVPLTEHDPRGAGLAAMALPLTAGGLVGGLVAGSLVALLVLGHHGGHAAPDRRRLTWRSAGCPAPRPGRLRAPDGRPRATRAERCKRSALVSGG